MTMFTVGDIWNLRTDPFYPEVDELGDPIPTGALERSLNPRVDRRVLPLYFNVYDWSFSKLIGELSRINGLDKFPGSRSRPSDTAFLILISGLGQTGLDSMVNLILHKIQRISGADPFVSEVELANRDTIGNVETVAREIVNAVEYAEPPLKNAEKLAEKLLTRVEREVKRPANERSFANVFSAFRKILGEPKADMVIWITDGGDNDSWASIQKAVTALAPYVIVTTRDELFAKSCYDAVLTRNRNVAWIRTSPLDEADALKFVSERIGAERLGVALAADDPLPFTRDAIAALYKPGSAATGAKPLAHPVGWLRRTLHRAMADHIGWIEQTYPDAAALHAAAPQHILIDADRIRDARDALNQGG